MRPEMTCTSAGMTPRTPSLAEVALCATGRELVAMPVQAGEGVEISGAVRFHRGGAASFKINRFDVSEKFTYCGARSLGAAAAETATVCLS